MDKDIDVEKLEEENRNFKKIYSTRSDMVSISAHQIRTSLSGLKWIIKMFLEGDFGKLTIEQENLLRKTSESNERMLAVVSEMLLMNKTESISEKEFSFGELFIVMRLVIFSSAISLGRFTPMFISASLKILTSLPHPL